MSIDEAIAREKEVAKEIYVEAMLCHANPDDGKLDDCIERGKYHEQLAEWLEELKAYIEIGTVEECRNSVLDIDRAYNNAIDDAKSVVLQTLDNDMLVDTLHFRLEQLKACGNIELSEYSKSKGNRTGK